MPTTVFRCLLLSLAIVHGSSYAASAHEQDQLSLIQQQLDTIERFATRAGPPAVCASARLAGVPHACCSPCWS